MKYFGYLLTVLAVTACKSSGSESEIAATAVQRNALTNCIVSTVMESYKLPTSEVEKVRGFAAELIARAPSDNDSSQDYRFESYTRDLGCDPNQKGENVGYGSMIVGEWAISPLNPANAPK